MKYFVEIRAGEGGIDASQFTLELFKYYEKALSNFWLTNIYKENGFISFEIENPPHLFLQESGGHRFQRIPFSEKRGRVHSSTVTVAVFLNKPNNFIFSEEDLVVEYYSGQGKGGMNRNKVQACCRIRHIPTGIVKTSQTRSRINSYENALKELKQAVLNQNHQNFSDKNNKVRQNLIGSGERSDKIRTYRFQDNLLIDHVNNKKLPLDSILKDMMVLWRKS